MKEAYFYEKLPNEEVQCLLCPRKCIIAEGKRGTCRTRENRNGTLYSLVYAKPCAISVEPIEKAPLYHFMPGHRRLCLATVGCNFMCAYCQNWHISQKSVEEVEYRNFSPHKAVSFALAQRATSVCFTFTEPIVCYEYMYETARLAKDRGLFTAMVSNGSINPEPLRQLLKVLDGVKIDLKGFTREFYHEVSSAKLEPVLRTLQIIKESGKWLEIVNLVVPTLNDIPGDMRRMCAWIVGTLGKEVPLHFTRFFPMYRMQSINATPVETLEKAHGIARETGLQFVYVGNVPGHPLNSTYCPDCNELLIKRTHFEIVKNRIAKGACPACGTRIPGVWSVELQA